MTTEEQAEKRNAGLAKARAAKRAKRAVAREAQESGAPVATAEPVEEGTLVQPRNDPIAAHALAQSQGTILQRQVQEVPTGKSIKVKRCVGYRVDDSRDDGREITKAVFETVKLPTYYYKIDMPPCGGTDLKINGMPYYHGAVYEFDSDTLKTVKDMIFRMWKHDAEIHGSDENFYRGQTRSTLSARGA